MSEESDRTEKDRELEASLRALVPSRLNVELFSELNRDRERLVVSNDFSPSQLRWKRALPFALIGSLAMAGFGYLRFGDQLAPAAPSPSTASPVALNQGAAAETLGGSFVPVSSHGFLMNTSSGGVIQTEEGPRERLNLEYRDAYHWHDPASGTNFRIFQPRSEELIVPLQTD